MNLLLRNVTGIFAAVLAAVMLFGSTASANSKYAAFVVHAETGDVLFSRYADQSRYPASLTKMMTLYLLFEAVENGELKLTDTMTVSKRASLQPASRLGMARGSKITVEKAIEALVIRSANDVATVVAEKLGGTESKFARKMTAKARALGMRRTTFRNASGLPDRRQKTTARDMATLSQRISQDFPEFFEYFDRTSFTWRGRTYRSHNKVAMNFSGANGLKTGYTRASGYNLATTIDRGNHRLIGIVLGGRSSATRDKHMRDILTKAYADIRRKPALIKSVHWVRPVPSLKPGLLLPEEEVEEAKPLTLAILIEDDGSIPIPTPKTLAMAAPISVTMLSEDTVSLDMDALRVAIADIENDDRLEGPIPVGQGDAEPITTRDWQIQVGAYKDEEQAIARIHAVQSVVRENAMIPGREVRISAKGDDSLFRARFTRLTEEEAQASCEALSANKSDCFVLKAE